MTAFQKDKLNPLKPSSKYRLKTSFINSHSLILESNKNCNSLKKLNGIHNEFFCKFLRNQISFSCNPMINGYHMNKVFCQNLRNLAKTVKNPNHVLYM